jgi:hypothetical protein
MCTGRLPLFFLSLLPVSACCIRPCAASAFAYQTPHLHALGGESEARFLSGLFLKQRRRSTTRCGPNYLAATCLKYNAGPRARPPSLCECLPALLASVADAPWHDRDANAMLCRQWTSQGRQRGWYIRKCHWVRSGICEGRGEELAEDKRWT